MTTPSHTSTSNDTDTDTDLPAALRMQLRGLRAHIAPPAGLWDAIDARLERPALRTAHRSHRPAYAMAAALALAAIGGAWAWSAQQTPATRWALAGDAASDAGLRATFATLDRDALEIRRALRQDPTSRVLLQQLSRVDAIRQTLGQRAALG